MYRTLTQQVGWFFSLFCLFVGTIWVSWLLHAQLDYGYPAWYQFYDIEEHIDKYGPKNRYKRGLQALDSEGHARLFSEITSSVHNHGAGLADIEYDYKGRSVRLLRKPEVQHLQDVANLIDVARPAGAAFLVVGLVGWGILTIKRSRPKARYLAIVGGAVVLTIAAVFWGVGAKDIFYQLHIWIFPEDHQWFFYYQDSLMATLMKAPVLFGGISATILIGALVLFLFPLSLWAVCRRESKLAVD